MNNANEHLTLDFSSQKPNLRRYYEARYQAKTQGKLSRLHSLHLADNLSFARRLNGYVSNRAQILLDVGVGAAQISNHLRFSKTIILDVSQELLRSRLPNARVAKICGLAEGLPLASQSISCLVATQVLEHVPDHQHAITEFARVIRTEGLLVLAVPNHYMKMIKIFHRISREIDLAGHLRVFQPELLLDELSSEFKIISTRETGYIIFWLLMCLERSKIGDRLIPVLNGLLGDRAAHVFSRLFDIENFLFKKVGGGMSYEVLAVKK